MLLIGKKCVLLDLVAHSFNPNYLCGRDQEDGSLRPTKAKILVLP
jgi:hypothetical protein